MRTILILSTVALFIGACSTNSGDQSNSCKQAGGTCEGTTPGACLGLVVGDNLGYTCASAYTVCCLPLSYSTCEKAGGACVQVGTCTSGTLDDAGGYSCNANGGAYDCCMTSADASR